MKFLSPEAAKNLVEFAGKSYRPKEILDLKEKIEGETRALEVTASVTGKIDEEHVRRIVNMKIQLDGLYGDWAEGKLS